MFNTSFNFEGYNMSGYRMFENVQRVFWHNIKRSSVNDVSELDQTTYSAIPEERKVKR